MRDRAFHAGVWTSYVVLWAILAVRPLDRSAWLLENVLVLSLVCAAFALRDRFTFSVRSSVLLALFLSLHAVGSHYTYSEVPYDTWFRALSGRGLSDLLGLHRNHYDRFVHFAAGLLLVEPLRDLWAQHHGLGPLTDRGLAVCFVMSGSMLYELLEWGAAAVFGGELGMAFLGTQGDVWDAQKDMLLATCGALIAALVAWRYTRCIRSPRGLVEKRVS